MPISTCIAELRVGDKGNIIRLKMTKAEHLRKLAAFGFFPGVEVEVLQKFPVYVLKIGHTQIALDEEFARNIIVDTSQVGLR